MSNLSPEAMLRQNAKTPGGQTFKIGPNQYGTPIAYYASRIPQLIRVRSVTVVNWSSNYVAYVWLNNAACEGMPELAIGPDSGLTLPCDTNTLGLFIGYTQAQAPAADGYIYMHLDSVPMSASIIQTAPGTPAGNGVRNASSWRQR